jgi:hypothetical protein
MVFIGLLAFFGVTGRAWAYPGGTPLHVSNMGTNCASCHSSTDDKQLRNFATAGQRRQQLIETKHLAKVKAGMDAYQMLLPEQREELIKEIQTIDENAEITMEAPTKLKRGQEFKVVVKTVGGGGPVIGVALVDADLRMQSSPIQTSGFLITAAPDIIGPDGQKQDEWLNSRAAELGKNLNYVNVRSITCDVENKKFSTAQVTYTLRAPMQPGDYTMTAAFLYGTEKGTKLGCVTNPMTNAPAPRGGTSGASGRVKFAEVLRIAVE